MIFQTVENLFCFQGFNLQKQGSINLYTPTQVFSCKYCEILNNSFFIEHLWWLLLNLVRRSEDIVEVFKIFYVWLINVLLICVYFSHFLLCIPYPVNILFYSSIQFLSLIVTQYIVLCLRNRKWRKDLYFYQFIKKNQYVSVLNKRLFIYRE